jgi:serine/threonine protein kinase/WD40 repeat protein
MTDNAEHDPLNDLAEEFLARYRRGERPGPGEYARRYPELAERILELFPMLVEMEGLHSELGKPAKPQRQALAARSPPDQLGEFRILREIGRGGMGIVYEAVQESLGRRVALKVLPFHELTPATQLERFQREARAAACLHHSNIVPVFGVGEQNGIHFYAMQFIQGQSLDAVLREVKRLRGQAGWLADSQVQAFPEPQTQTAQAVPGGEFPQRKESPETRDEVAGQSSGGARTSSTLSGQTPGLYYRSVARLIAQVADAVEYAHRHGILHRDLKPANLLVDSEGTPWVTDFGLAKAEDSVDLTRSGDLVGTLRYMAPERLEGKADARSDVYSLGLTLYEMLTLRPAFPDEDRALLRDRLLHDRPPAPRRIDPLIPRDLETIVLKAMAPEPEHRFATAAELAEDLRQFLAGKPIRARRVGPLERFWRWCRRNPGIACLSGAVLLLLLVLAVGSTLTAWRLGTLLDESEKSKKDAVEKLWQSCVDSARAGRMSNRIGQRFNSLAALKEAVRIAREQNMPQERFLLMRNEAIACLALPDLRLVPELSRANSAHATDITDDMSIYARGDRKGAVSVRRVSDDGEIARFPAFGKGWISTVHLSRDGRYLAVWADRSPEAGGVKVWDLSGAKPACLIDHSDGVLLTYWDFPRDNRRFACALSDGSIQLYALPSGKPLRRIKVSPDLQALAFHPCKSLLAVCFGQSVHVYDAETGKLTVELQHATTVNSIVWQPGGRRLAACCDNFKIYLWDVAARKQVVVMAGLRAHGSSAMFNPAGDLLVSREWGYTWRLWDPLTGRQLLSTPGLLGNRFSQDGRRLALGESGTKLDVYELADRSCFRVLVRDPILDEGHYLGLDISPCGRLLAVGMMDGIDLWNLPRGVPLTFVRRKTPLVQFLPTGALLSSESGGLMRWPLRKKAVPPQTLQFGPPEKLAEPPPNWAVFACSRDGGVIVRQEPTGIVVRHGAHLGKTVLLRSHPGAIFVAVSPNGLWVATGTHQGTKVKVWEAASGKLVKELPIEGQSRVGFSPDGRWLLTNGGSYRLWAVGSWKEGPLLDTAPYTRFAFSPDSKLLAVETGFGVLRLVEVETGREIARLENPYQERAEHICFSPDGTRLVTNAEQKSLHVWDLRAIRRELAELGLDWDLPAYPPEPAERPGGALQIEIVGVPPADLHP